MDRNFQSFTTVEAAERAAKAEAEGELRHAINNHAENLENLNAGYTGLFQKVQRLEAQVSALLDGNAVLTQQIQALQSAREDDGLKA